jgi:hypothetical protein
MKVTDNGGRGVRLWLPLGAIALLGFAACGADTGGDDCESCDSSYNDGYVTGWDGALWDLAGRIERDGSATLFDHRVMFDPAETANAAALSALEIATETGYTCETTQFNGGSLQIDCDTEGGS